ncbi:MAG: hypothetical protein ACYS6W_18385 [Planctomycetota bacterium]
MGRPLMCLDCQIQEAEHAVMAAMDNVERLKKKKLEQENGVNSNT